MNNPIIFVFLQRKCKDMLTNRSQPHLRAQVPQTPITLYINVAKRPKAWSRTYSQSTVIENEEAGSMWPISVAPRLNPRAIACGEGRRPCLVLGRTNAHIAHYPPSALHLQCDGGSWHYANADQVQERLPLTVDCMCKCTGQVWLFLRFCFGKRGRAMKWDEREDD